VMIWSMRVAECGVHLVGRVTVCRKPEVNSESM